MDMFKKQDEKVQESTRRINELKKSFLNFISLDENFMFSVELESRSFLEPYMDEVTALKKNNASIAKAIQDAREIYVQLRQKDLIQTQAEHPEEPVNVIEGTIRSYKTQVRVAAEKLERLKIIDPKSLETIIPPENKKQADELKKVITSGLPGKIEALEDAKRRIEKLFVGLDIQIPASGANLPKREGEVEQA